MSEKTFHSFIGTLFAIVGTFHLMRLFFGWQVTMMGWNVPVWGSFFGIIIAWFLSYTAFSLVQKNEA